MARSMRGNAATSTFGVQSVRSYVQRCLEPALWSISIHILMTDVFGLGADYELVVRG